MKASCRIQSRRHVSGTVGVPKMDSLYSGQIFSVRKNWWPHSITRNVVPHSPLTLCLSPCTFRVQRHGLMESRSFLMARGKCSSMVSGSRMNPAINRLAQSAGRTSIVRSRTPFRRRALSFFIRRAPGVIDGFAWSNILHFNLSFSPFLISLCGLHHDQPSPRLYRRMLLNIAFKTLGWRSWSDTCCNTIQNVSCKFCSIPFSITFRCFDTATLCRSWLTGMDTNYCTPAIIRAPFHLTALRPCI
jgi:hypothetical protein